MKYKKGQILATDNVEDGVKDEKTHLKKSDKKTKKELQEIKKQQKTLIWGIVGILLITGIFILKNLMDNEKR